MNTKRDPNLFRTLIWIIGWTAVSGLCFGVNARFENLPTLPGGLSVATMLGLLAGIMAISNLALAATQIFLARRRKPAVEGLMVGRLYQLLAFLLAVLTVLYGFGRLESAGTFLAMFGGMLLGWSLQAPVSGFAAWVLVSVKRPFRPGDRIQFPSLGLVGDVTEMGVMYTVLDQVGGTIGSEEAVGRYILVPNAMLFSQVVINYTVTQEAAFMLDEVVIRITYDSNWEVAEAILVGAAREVTADIIAASKVEPYVRSDWYDYGVYLRLRYQTSVKDRVEIAYRIQKRIFEGIQKSPNVDMAIPYIYSYRAGMDQRDAQTAREPKEKGAWNVREIPLTQVRSAAPPGDAVEVQELAASIAKQGLLQPIVVIRNPQAGDFEIVAGDLRFEACKRLGWKTIPAVVKGGDAETS